MMRRLFPLTLVLAACGVPATQSTTLDVRVALPSSDPAFIDFAAPEATIEAGTDKMWCSVVTYTGADTAFTLIDGRQGKFGHHIVLLESKGDEPEGVPFECGKMTTFRPFAIPVFDSLPNGYAAELKKGTRLVVQSHYVNTGKNAIVVRDIIRLTKKDPTTVTTWIAPGAHADVGFNIPPHSNGTASVTCTLSEDVQLLVLGGHMHEWGTSVTIEMGPSVAELKTAYEVTQWKPEYRDTPPVNLSMNNPVQLRKGDVFRTTCHYNNTTDTSLGHPEEMCANFMMLAGTKNAFVCFTGNPKP